MEKCYVLDLESDYTYADCTWMRDNGIDSLFLAVTLYVL